MRGVQFCRAAPFDMLAKEEERRKVHVRKDPLKEIDDQCSRRDSPFRFAGPRFEEKFEDSPRKARNVGRWLAGVCQRSPAFASGVGWAGHLPGRLVDGHVAIQFQQIWIGHVPVDWILCRSSPAAYRGQLDEKACQVVAGLP